MERSLGKILSLFYETLYLWTAAFVSPLLLSFSNFFVRFALPLLGVPFVYFKCT
jgi:hypothetical protein